MDRFLTQLARRLRIPDADVITADEVRDWPAGKLDELLAEGVLQEIEPGTTVVCDQCDERCPVEPQLRTDPRTGRVTGVHICMREEVGGRIEIDLERLRRWTINRRELSKLGYTSNKGEATLRGSRKDKKENELFVLRTALLQHHGLGSGKVNWEPATQKRLHELTDWNQPKVHRMMKALFGSNPMHAYKSRCKERTLRGFLRKKDDGSHDIEAYATTDAE